MSAKDNFAQAFKELLSGSDSEENTQSSSPVNNEPVNNVPPKAAAPVYDSERSIAEPVPVPAAAAAPIKDKSAGFGGFGFGRKQSADTFAANTSAPSYGGTQGGGFSSDSMSDYTAPAGATTIALGTVVIGEIHSKGDLNLYGEIKGNVETTGNINLGGRIMGNIIGNDMTITTSAVKGNVAASGAMSIDSGSVVLGDLKAREAQFDGQVKGNLTVEGLAHFLSDTVLLGNVSVGSLIIDEGARLRGEICTGSRDRFDITDPFQG
ncbi:MAG: polymer-forming cytoskeletal protein [Oscillospiraceae bacterium]